MSATHNQKLSRLVKSVEQYLKDREKDGCYLCNGRLPQLQSRRMKSIIKQAKTIDETLI